MANSTTPLLDAMAKLLEREDDPEVRIATAVVVAELARSSPAIERGLGSMLATDAAPFARAALRAAARVPSVGLATHAVPWLAHRDPEVRGLAVEAVVAAGQAVVPALRARLADADGELRKGIDAALARFGETKEAVVTLLGNLATSDADTARAIAAAVRPQIRMADRKTRTLWLAELDKVVERLRKQPPVSPIPLATAVKLLGYVDDERATERLLAFATDARASLAVRQEALIALRTHTTVEAHAEQVVEALVSAAEGPDRILAQAALMSLAAAELPRAHAARLVRIAAAAELERAQIAVDKLARVEGPEVTKALVGLAASSDRKRRELAIGALEGRDGAVPALVAAFLDASGDDVAIALKGALRGKLAGLTTAQRTKLLDRTLAAVEAGHATSAHLEACRELVPEGLANGLRAFAKAAARRKDGGERQRSLLALLTQSREATAADHFARFALELERSPLEPSPHGRAKDACLPLAEALSAGGFDLRTALRKDGRFTADALYYLGFHLAERGDAAGRDLLEEVVATAGRTKVGKMAKNKLALLGDAG